MFEWFPHAFGSPDLSDPHKHEIVIQQVIPTRTGLDGIKSSVTVWLSAVNGSEPMLPPRIVRRPRGIVGRNRWNDEEYEDNAQ